MRYDEIVAEMFSSIDAFFATQEDRYAAEYITEKYLKQLAAVSAQQEREACAAACDECYALANRGLFASDIETGQCLALKVAAEAIRNRGKE